MYEYIVICAGLLMHSAKSKTQLLYLEMLGDLYVMFTL